LSNSATVNVSPPNTEGRMTVATASTTAARTTINIIFFVLVNKIPPLIIILPLAKNPLQTITGLRRWRSPECITGLVDRHRLGGGTGGRSLCRRGFDGVYSPAVGSSGGVGEGYSPAGVGAAAALQD